MSDNELDETFDSTPITLDLPQPLTSEESAKLLELMKSKSNKELTELVTNISIHHNDKLNDMQKMQLSTNFKQNLGNISKRELINTISQIVNQSNKNLVFQDSSKLETLNEKEKLSRDELLKKLHEKQKMSNKNNIKKMYEKLQEEMNQQSEQTQSEQTQSEEKKKKKKKKNKNANPKQMQEMLVNKLTEFMKTQTSE